MEIVRAVLVLALAVGVAVLVLALAAYMWPPVKPYGEALPYITVKNTSKGIQLGAFDYSNIKPKAAYIYVNGRLAGSVNGEGWSGVYVKCGDYVEVLFQYDGFNRKVAGRIGCSKPLQRGLATPIAQTWTSKNALEAISALDSLGVNITATCRERGYTWGWLAYPVFYINNFAAQYIEYKTDTAWYSGKKQITVDPGGAYSVTGIFRAYKMPSYGFTVGDYVATREVQMTFDVVISRCDGPYCSTLGYVSVDGAKYLVANCTYVVSKVVTTVEDTYSVLNKIDPTAIYDFVAINNATGATYHITIVYYGDKAARVIASRLGYGGVNPAPGSMDLTGCVDTPIGYKLCGPLIAGYIGMEKLEKVVNQNGYTLNDTLNEMRRAFAEIDYFDKTYGSPYVERQYTHHYTYVDFVLKGKEFKPGRVTVEGAWLAVPGVFRGLASGGWDMFSNYLRTVWTNATAGAGSAAPPYVFTVG
jgi:hypothetical protein